MINITFPDGNVRQYAAGTTALDVAKSISEGLARVVLAASVNGEVRHLPRPINEDARIVFHKWEDFHPQSLFPLSGCPINWVHRLSLRKAVALSTPMFFLIPLTNANRAFEGPQLQL